MFALEICGAFKSRLFLFLSACLSGILFALVWRKYEQTVQFTLMHNHYTSALRDTNYNMWLRTQNFSKQVVSEEILSFSGHASKENIESEFLYNSTPILCLIFVNSHQGADIAKKTWAKHCNVPVYFGRFVDTNIPVIKIPPVTSFEGFCNAFIHIFYKYAGRYKWVLIADDLTYASIENLRYYVAPLNESLPYYLGHPVKGFSNLYNVGTAGMVLSHGSMSLIHSTYKTMRDCEMKPGPSWYFDQSIAKILQKYNVYPVDTRDSYLRGRFNPFSVETMLIPGSISVFSSYWRSSAFLVEEGMNCCSDRAITFHGLLPSKMLLMEYVLYHLTAFRNSFKGLGNEPPQASANPEENEISDKSLKDNNVGEAFIELLNKDLPRKDVTGKSKKKNSVNIWQDIFGS